MVGQTKILGRNAPRYPTPAGADFRLWWWFNPLSQGALYQGTAKAFDAQDEKAWMLREYGSCEATTSITKLLMMMFQDERTSAVPI
ncbi:hypothetical protein ACVWZ4_006865 [Bradyrhizobium sp. USDA 4472]